MASFLSLRSCLNKCPFKATVPLQSLKARPPHVYHQTRGFMRSRHPRENPKDIGYSQPDQQTVLKVGQSKGDHVSFSKLFKPFIFTITFTGTAFTLAAIVEHEQTIMNRKKYGPNYDPHRRFRRKDYTPEKTVWQQTSDGLKVYTVIAALNLVVFAFARIPPLRPIVTNYFYSSPVTKGLCSSMILSTFMHSSPLHLFINMYVLYSFVVTAVPVLGKEQFTAMYLSAGVFSNLLSFLSKTVTGITKPSVGASGAIAGILGYVASRYPEAKLHIVFLPQLDFSAGPALKVWLTIEAICCSLRFSIFDHAGHFGGGIFGVFWHNFVQEHLWSGAARMHIIKTWQEMKNLFTPIPKSER